MLIDRETAVKSGYSPIVSDKQAYNFLRREFKQLHKRGQRRNKPDLVSCHSMLQIRAGNWFKFLRLTNGLCVLMIIEVKD